MKLSSTFLGAIAVAQADDHPGIFKKSKYKLIKKTFQIFMVLVSRMKNKTEFFHIMPEKLTVSKNAWRIVVQWGLMVILMLVLSSKPNAIAVRNQKMDSIHCTLGPIGAI